MSAQRVIEIGGTHVTSAVVDLNAATVVSAARRSISPDIGVGALLAVIEDSVEASSGTPCEGAWSVAIPGPFDYANGIGMFNRGEKFAKLSHLDLRAALVARFPQAESIVFMNDAAAFAVGQWEVSGDKVERMVCVTLGTGIGSSFLLNGQPIDSWPGVPPLGHLYLTRWRGDPLETHVSRAAIRSAYFDLTGSGLDVEAIANLARGDDEPARDALARTFAVLGEAIGPSIEAFDPDVIVFGGSISRSWDLIQGPISRGLESSVLQLPLLQAAERLNDAPLVGAAALGRRLMAMAG